MQAMQYHITLPSDYDMVIIRQRVGQTGHLMDGFPGLLFKAFLIGEKEQGEQHNSYCPLYVWQDDKGMTDFIFNGYFDNILRDFGWRPIEIGVTASVVLKENFEASKFVTLEVIDIASTESLESFPLHEKIQEEELGKVISYNPDKWKKNIFTFYADKPQKQENIQLFEILHISR
ncbi:DUF4865 family protein [Streptococcus sobrinus]|uniref:DUF4865 family protein n=1 Tax=Streptococcus sobrinus TaxID=1310 RepID=UPI0002D29B6B|nr:DUF4865 family protein [Streptococcus sobrinus]AWN19038.1 DUF4865 domain-containing protein [Streptococcus sobrinus]